MEVAGSGQAALVARVQQLFEDELHEAEAPDEAVLEYLCGILKEAESTDAEELR